MLEEIERFNRRHGRSTRPSGAVGAGAKNFVATCVRRLDDAGSVFAALPLDETGASPLRSSTHASRTFACGHTPQARSSDHGRGDFARAFLDERTVQHMFKRVEAVTSAVAEQV